MKLVVSDAHAGHVATIQVAFQGASWQRCRVHFMRNVLSKIPRTAGPMVAAIIRTVFVPRGKRALVERRLDEVVAILERSHPAAAEMLDEARDELLAFAAFPSQHWQQIWSTNPLERLNKEIKRRTKVVGTFPNPAALLRLAGHVLIEQHDDWDSAGHRYFSEHSMRLLDLVPEEVPIPELTAA